MTLSRLLKSCARPPVSWPMASSFWAWRSCASMSRRWVMSSSIAMKWVMRPLSSAGTSRFSLSLVT